MKLASIRIVTNDLERLIGFYEQLTGVVATRLAPDFAEVRLAGAVLAISTERMVKQFNAGVCVSAANRSAILELQLDRADEVDGVHARLAGARADIAMAPTTMPWGNRSLLLRDPDGNVINVFARPPHTAQ
ncbi:MAG TPA: VOC family protein [Polyangia bacterium]|jgi:uncharacterized glyoxalase superfamily protein PhnB|nr:VOC family protein [Polyangia bacterium]